MNLKFLNKSFDRTFLPGILALIFLLILALSDVTLSQESQAGKQEVLRKASQQWMQAGMDQYQRDLFTDAEQSFRRALIFQKYLTAAEREQLNKLLANARIAISEGKPAVASTQTADESVQPSPPVKAAAIVAKAEESRPPAQQARRQTTEVKDKKSEQPAPRKEPSVEVVRAGVSKIQVKAGSLSSVVVVKNDNFGSKFMQLSSWLSQNRRYFLMICLPVLAVLIFISKLQAGRKRPGRRVYTHHVPQNASFIGSRLNGSKENNRAIEDSEN